MCRMHISTYICHWPPIIVKCIGPCDKCPTLSELRSCAFAIRCSSWLGVSCCIPSRTRKVPCKSLAGNSACCVLMQERESIEAPTAPHACPPPSPPPIHAASIKACLYYIVCVYLSLALSLSLSLSLSFPPSLYSILWLRGIMALLCDGGETYNSGVAQWLACWAHNPKVRGSKPCSASQHLPFCTDATPCDCPALSAFRCPCADRALLHHPSPNPPSPRPWAYS
jgi:hypothetical protein